jgi:hypothetical protein
MDDDNIISYECTIFLQVSLLSLQKCYVCNFNKFALHFKLFGALYNTIIFYNLNEIVMLCYKIHYIIFNFIYVQKSSNLFKLFFSFALKPK